MDSTSVKRLHDNDTLRLLPGRGGLLLTSRAGTFLVTQERDPQDHVLEPGGELRTAGRGVVVVWALSDGAIAVEPGPGARLGPAIAELPPPAAAPPARAA